MSRNFGYKKSYFGSDAKGHDVKAFGNTTGKYIYWNRATNKLEIQGDLEVNGASLAASSRISNLTAATLAITSAYDGKVITINNKNKKKLSTICF
jgi:hypothetical protein